MPFSVVLDTCVLYPSYLRDTLLRLAERRLYRALWSRDIVEELRRNLLESGVEAASIDHLADEMQKHFDDSEIRGYEHLVETMTCDAKDRHVLAVAVKADAAAIVTANVDDFPPQSIARYDIEVIHPDDFLLDLLDLAHSVVLQELDLQVAAHQREPTTLTGLLRALEIAGVPSFAEEVRRRVG